MAKIPGGITSRPSGQLGNIIFGAARTASGKVATAREAVAPSNPNTSAQQAQRSQFQMAVAIVQALGPDIYQEDWNRSVGQLPGFQSWQSILLNNMDNSDLLSAPPDRQLGSLHVPDSISASTGAAAGEIDLTWSTETGANGADGDAAVVLAIEAPAPSDRSRDVLVSRADSDRSDGAFTATVAQDATDYVLGLYFSGGGRGESALSTCRFLVATSA